MASTTLFNFIFAALLYATSIDGARIKRRKVEYGTSKRSVSSPPPEPPDRFCNWEFVANGGSEDPAAAIAHLAHGAPPSYIPRYAIDSSEKDGLESLVRIKEKRAGDSFPLADAWLCKEPSARTVLVGPFHSEVQQWHSIVFHEFPWLKKDDCIVEFIGDTVSAEDTSSPITFPPLHMHHIHIEREAPHWWETHGDYTLTSKKGYNMTLPSGTCVRHDGQRVSIAVHVNDVRFLEGGGGCASKPVSHLEVANARRKAKPYSWYFRAKFKLAPTSEVASTSSQTSAPTALSKVAFYYPQDEFSHEDLLQRYDVGNTTHVMWWQIRLPYSGTLLPETVRLHSHRSRYAGYVLVRGNHSLENLTGLPAGCSSGNTCESIYAIRDRVLTRAGSEVLCQDNPSIPNYIEGGEHDKGYGGKWDRQGLVVCKPFSFYEGQIVTVFSFTKPLWLFDVAPFPQHTILFGYFRPNHSKDDDAPDAGYYSTVEQLLPIKHGMSRFILNGSYKVDKFGQTWF